MELLNLFWLDLVCVGLICVLVNGAITGSFYSHGRGGPPKLIASMKSHRLRLFFLLVAAGLLMWVIIDLKHKLALSGRRMALFTRAVSYSLRSRFPATILRVPI